MENVLKKIFSGKNDEIVHYEFIKFGRGEFKNKYVLEGKKQKDKWSVKTSAEFANFLVEKCLENFSGRLKVTGAIICTSNLSEEAGFEIKRIKQFMGVKQMIVDCELDSSKITGLMKKYPRAFYALTFSTPEYDLKIKPKAPKSGKPGTKEGGGPKVDFCSLKTSNKEMVNDLFFDFMDFTNIKISHTLKIEQVILPKGIDDPVKMRDLAVKKGKIIREIEVDGRKDIKEVDFEA